MGLGNSFINLGRIVGPIWAGFIFDVNWSYPYLSGAAIMLVGFLIGLRWVSQGKDRNELRRRVRGEGRLER